MPSTRSGRTAGLVTLAVLSTAAALVAAGTATGAIRLPGSAAKPRGHSPSTSPTVSGIVPSGWQTFVTDSLGSSGNWSSDNDPANTSSCSVEGQLTVTKKTSGTYRCKGPTKALGDQVIQVDVTLRTTNVCGGVWLRFGPAPATGAEAGYLLEVCQNKYVLATHGLTDTSSLVPIDTFPVTLTMGQPARVGVLARGTGFAFYLNGKQIGQRTDDTFTHGRTLLGIVVPVPDSGNHQVTFANVQIAEPPA